MDTPIKRVPVKNYSPFCILWSNYSELDLTSPSFITMGVALLIMSAGILGELGFCRKNIRTWIVSVQFFILGDWLFCGAIFRSQSRTGRYTRSPNELGSWKPYMNIILQIQWFRTQSDIVFNRKHKWYKQIGTYLYIFSTFVDPKREILLCPLAKCPGTPFESSGSPIACLTTTVLNSFAYLGCTNIALTVIDRQLSSLRSKM